MKLHQLDLPWKLLITMFLIVLSSGFVTAELYLMHTTEMADGQKGLTIDDITYQFHGDPTKTTLKKQVEGGMKKYFSEVEDDTKLTEEELADLAKVVAWNDAGAQEAGFWDPQLKEKDKNPNSVYRIFLNRGCLDCHAKDATMKGHKKDSPLETYAEVSKFTKPDTGMDKGRLLSLSHIHLLGMGMMFMLAGAAVALSIWPMWIRSALVVGGFSSILLDIFGWWGVKWYGASLSWVVMAGGILMAVSFGGSVFVALYDLWLRKVPRSEEPGRSEVPPVLKDAPVAPKVISK
ncbi:MAG TPA: hypothetical protein VD994_20640 [Prosthecobacter sp.]|nr:hypothetical protein [Prosthecobacter sp.]